MADTQELQRLALVANLIDLITQNAMKDVIRAYFMPEMYKLYQSAMPSTAKAENLFLSYKS